MVARQRALHQPLHPQTQPVQFVVDLQSGQAAGSVGFAVRVVLVGPRASRAAAAAAFVLGRLGVGVLAGVDGFEHAEVLLVAVEGQHQARVVNSGVSSLVVAAAAAAAAVGLRGVLGEFQEAVHPLPVLVQVQEGEVQRQAPEGSRRSS